VSQARAGGIKAGARGEALARPSGWLPLTLLGSATHRPPSLSRPAPTSLPHTGMHGLGTLPLAEAMGHVEAADARPRRRAPESVALLEGR
jgi:hypothetical protein